MSRIVIKNVKYRGEEVNLLVDEQHVIVNPNDISRDMLIIEAKGLIAIPGLRDYHAHFCDPGLTESEDVLSGAQAAAAGGYVSVVCQPNTRPVVDSVAAVNAFHQRVVDLDIPIEVFIQSALTKGQQGDELVEFKSLIDTNIIGISEDGERSINKCLLVQALKEIDSYMSISASCEETASITERQGRNASYELEIIRLNLEAWKEASASGVDIRGMLGIECISLPESIDIIDDSGKEIVTCVTPHHLLLCEEDIPLRNSEPDPNWKVSPPFRSREQMMSLRRSVREGKIGGIVTAHDPHSPSDKAKSWDRAPSGVIGLETAFSACLQLVHSEEIYLGHLVEMMGNGIHQDRIIDNSVTLVDLNHLWTVDPNKFYSKSCNCPFTGMNFKGKVVHTIARGKSVMSEGEVLF